MPGTNLAVRRRPYRDAIGHVAFAAVYFTIASLSVISFGVNTPIWFTNAFAVAWLVQRKRSKWPTLLALLYLVDAAAIRLFAEGPPLMLAVADVFETLVAALLIRRLGGAEGVFSSVARLAAFVAICIAVPVVSASWGAATLWGSLGVDFLPNFSIWYLASALGMLVACPIFLIWFTPALHSGLPPRDRIVMAAMLAGLGALSFAVSGENEPTYLFVTFPALLMLVWRGGLLGAATGAAVLVAVGLGRISSGHGAFAVIANSHDVLERVEALQVYLAALTLSSLPLAVVLGDQRRLSRELARVAEARSEFLAAMSHEIRTPMTGVLGMVDLLETEQPTERQRTYLQSIRSSGRHLLSVINDVLDFTRIETGRIELERIDFSLPAMLEQVQSVLHSIAAERGIRLAVGLSEHSPPVVRGDPTRVKQILLNLAGNAIKFTPAGSVIVLAAHRPDEPGHRFRFEIRDSGIGIAEEKLPHIFTAFTQADNSTSRRYGGSGLGLAISKRLVDAMGGEIGVESELGQGSLFWFEIPFEPGDPVNLPVAQSPDDQPIEPRRVLLAEDVELNRDIIRTVLERDGHHVTIAETGLEALEWIKRQCFDLVLMDVHMPIMDGLEATRAIRSLPGPEAGLPIIALTANVMTSEQEKCRSAGMDAVLMKPIDWEQVRTAIRQYGERNEECDPVGTASDYDLAFDEKIFGELAAMIPADRLRQYGAILGSDVRTLVQARESEDASGIAAAAHKIVSQAGMFGLTRLSLRASQVEEAVRGERGIGVALDRFRSASADLDDQLLARLDAMEVSSAG